MKEDHEDFDRDIQRIDKLRAENIDAICASIADFRRGERGTPADEHSQEHRKEFGIA